MGLSRRRSAPHLRPQFPDCGWECGSDGQQYGCARVGLALGHGPNMKIVVLIARILRPDYFLLIVIRQERIAAHER